MTIGAEKEYVLGTGNEESARLELQHRVWRPRALDAWHRGGITSGTTVIDIGCGPGYASLDLAEIVGPTGRVFAIDRSRRFLGDLDRNARQRGLSQVTLVEHDVENGMLPGAGADAAWARWVFAFLRQPRALVEGIRDALRPGGITIIHEYFDYSTWRLVPESEIFNEFVAAVMKSWRDQGGEPDIGRTLPAFLQEAGFEIRSLRPIIDVAGPGEYVWQWPKLFVESGTRRLVELDIMTQRQATEVQESFAEIEARPHPLMVTPGVLEIIAVRR